MSQPEYQYGHQQYDATEQQYQQYQQNQIQNHNQYALVQPQVQPQGQPVQQQQYIQQNQQYVQPNQHQQNMQQAQYYQQQAMIQQQQMNYAQQSPHTSHSHSPNQSQQGFIPMYAPQQQMVQQQVPIQAQQQVPIQQQQHNNQHHQHTNSNSRHHEHRSSQHAQVQVQQHQNEDNESPQESAPNSPQSGPVDSNQEQQQINTKARSKKKKSRRVQTKKNRKVGRWFLGETLGKGGYSWVKKGYDRQDGRVVALKFTSKAKGNWSENQSKQVQNEIEALRQIKHKHVLQLLAYNLNAKYPQKDGTVIPTVLLVLEYLPGGELFDILYYTHALKEHIARTYFHQLLDGMYACHQAGICHRDIKPQNLLLDSHFQLKIADFGLAKVFEKDDNSTMSTFYVGTRGYQAPEILNKKEYSFPCDIFSCGVVLFILLAGYPPFEAATPKCRWYAPLAAGNAREFWKQHRGCGIPSPAKDLITRMLWYDKDKRIGIAGIKKHKWFNGEKLSPKQLVKELKTLHRLMEIKRKEDALRQDKLQESVKDPAVRSLRKLGKWVTIVDTPPPPATLELRKQQMANNESTALLNRQNGDDIKVSENDEHEVYYQGDVIKDCAELLQATLSSEIKETDFDITSVVSKQFVDFEKQVLKCDNVISGVINHLKHVNDIVKKIAEAGDAQIKLIYSHVAVECVAPAFPTGDTVSFKDVFTQRAPRFTLEFIQQVILETGGKATIDIEECSIEARLATHNFPAPVFLAVRIYFSHEYECHLVRFARISGDVLHFGRVLRKLIGKCAFVLTGLPDDKFNVSEEEQKLVATEDVFGVDFNIEDTMA